MTTPQKSNTTPPVLSVLERLDQIDSAWSQYAPEILFGNMTRAEFEAAVAPSRTTRATLSALGTTVKGGIAGRIGADKSTATLLKRVVSGVKSSPAFGEDSGLYRALGYIPISERKPPARPGTVVKASTPIIPPLMERLAKAVEAWSELAPEAKFGEMTLSQFRVATAASTAIRTTLSVARTNYSSGMAARRAADLVTRGLIRRLTGSVIGDPAYGNNSELYRAMGYTIESERRSSRKAATTTPAAQAV